MNTTPEHQAALDKIKELEERYVNDLYDSQHMAGILHCVKCGFRLISRTLYMKSGTIGPNNVSESCPNCATPMWKVSKDNELRNRSNTIDKVWDENKLLKEKITTLHSIINEMREFMNEIEEQSKIDDWTVESLYKIIETIAAVSQETLSSVDLKLKGLV